MLSTNCLMVSTVGKELCNHFDKKMQKSIVEEVRKDLVDITQKTKNSLNTVIFKHVKAVGPVRYDAPIIWIKF